MTSYCPVPGVGPETPADRNYEGGFAAALMLKDLKLAMEAAEPPAPTRRWAAKPRNFTSASSIAAADQGFLRADQDDRRQLGRSGTLRQALIPPPLRGPHATMLIHTEETPNPATRKFLPGMTVMEAGVRDFVSAEAAEASPLAAALFATGQVEGVFFGRDFVSVTAAPGGQLERPGARRARCSCSTISLAARRCSRPGPPPASTSTRRRQSPKIRPTPTSSTRSRTHRNPRSAGGCAGRRRHRLSRLFEGHALSRHAGRLQRLPVVGGDLEARNRRPDPPLCSRGREHRSDLVLTGLEHYLLARRADLCPNSRLTGRTCDDPGNRYFDRELQRGNVRRRRRADRRARRSHRPRPCRTTDADDRGAARRQIPTHILVACGPGSFTGLRVGIAAAHGMAIGWDVPLAGMSSLALLAAGAPGDGPVAAAMTGGHGELFVQAFDRPPLLPPATAQPVARRCRGGGRDAARHRNRRGAARRGARHGRSARPLPVRAPCASLPAPLRTLDPRPLYGRAPDARARQAA